MPTAKHIEQLTTLLSSASVEDWRNRLFKLGAEMGYEQTRIAILPDPNAPIEAEHAFQHSNYATAWIDKYTATKLHHIDPTVAHCISKSTPLIWSPDLFSGRRQLELYEEASGYGVKSGITLPIHGANGELGILCFVSDRSPDKHFQEQAHQQLPLLSYCRDFVFESSLKFIKSPHDATSEISITPRELECMKWAASGKSSWEIGNILRCTEANVNYHFGNIRRKFNTNSRQQVIARAIKLGLIDPG